MPLDNLVTVIYSLDDILERILTSKSKQVLSLLRQGLKDRLPRKVFLEISISPLAVEEITFKDDDVHGERYGYLSSACGPEIIVAVFDKDMKVFDLSSTPEEIANWVLERIPQT